MIIKVYNSFYVAEMPRLSNNLKKKFMPRV